MNDQKKWYVAVNGQSIGPMTLAELTEALQAGRYAGHDYVFTEGMAGWVPASQVPELRGVAAARPVPPPPPSAAAPLTADDVDYEIQGDEMQFVEIELDPGESAVAEAGAMMFMEDGIEMQTVFGDASQKSQQGGFMDKLVGAGKRLLTGESLFMTVFTHNGRGKARVAFAAPYPGKIIPVDLREYGGTLICQKDAFLSAAKGVSIGIAFQKKIGVALFGGEGFIMQKLEGSGLAFLHAGGTIVKRQLAAGETLRIDTGCIVALDSSIRYDIQMASSVKSALFGGEGFFFALVTGPGTVWLQSLPFSRLAGRVWKAAPQAGGKAKEEGSVLGGLAGMLDGS